MQNINNILARNREILEGYKSGNIVSYLELMKKGFNFAYKTHETNFENVTYICCYETAYQFTNSEKNKVKILFFKYK